MTPPPLADQIKPPLGATLEDGSPVRLTSIAHDILSKGNIQEEIRAELRAMGSNSGVEFKVSFPM